MMVPCTKVLYQEGQSFVVKESFKVQRREMTNGCGIIYPSETEVPDYLRLDKLQESELPEVKKK